MIFIANSWIAVIAFVGPFHALRRVTGFAAADGCAMSSRLGALHPPHLLFIRVHHRRHFGDTVFDEIVSVADSLNLGFQHGNVLLEGLGLLLRHRKGAVQLFAAPVKMLPALPM